MRALFPYFGSKRKVLHILRAVLDAAPRPDVRVELFCGSASWLISSPPARIEIANDADGLLVNTLRAIRSDPRAVARLVTTAHVTEADLIAMHRALIAASDDLRKKLETSITHYDCDLASYWLVIMTSTVGKKVWNDTRPTPTFERSGVLAMTPDEAGAALCAFARRMRHVTILCRPWEAALERVCHPRPMLSDKRIAILIDPPYPRADERLYACDDFGATWYAAARRAVEIGEDLRYRIAVCGNDDAPSDAVFPASWSRIRWRRGKGFAAFRREQPDAAELRECIWCSPGCFAVERQQELSLQEKSEEEAT